MATNAQSNGSTQRSPVTHPSVPLWDVTPRPQRSGPASAGSQDKREFDATVGAEPTSPPSGVAYGMNQRPSGRVTIGTSNRWIGSGCSIRVPPDAKKSAIWP